MLSFTFLCLSGASAFAQGSNTDASAVPLSATPATSTQGSPAPGPADAPSLASEKPDPTKPISDALEGNKARYFAAGPEGKTLPEGVLRARLAVRFASGDSGFDKAGKKTDPGAQVNAVGSGVVIEYGVSNLLSLQVLVPFVLQNELGLNADQFRKSETYKTQLERFKSAAAKLLAKREICRDDITCRELINSGYSLPSDTNVTLPTGETLQVKARTPLNQVADAVVMAGAKPASGKTGLGDVEVGALYEVLNQKGPFTGSPIFLSVGGGFRFPTGAFADVPGAYRATGRGTLDFGLRTNLDYTPTQGLFLSWQNQAEFMVRKGTKKKSSILNNTELNSANPSSAAAIDAGSNGKGNEVDFERRGVRNVGFAKLGYGLGALSESLESIGMSTQLRYDVDSKEYLGGEAQGDPRRLYTWQTGVSFDGLAYRWPVQAFLDYELPVGGRNVSIAAENLYLEVRGFYRF
jgi:hypothetical protein